jgi:hypothetical protein
MTGFNSSVFDSDYAQLKRTRRPYVVNGLDLPLSADHHVFWLATYPTRDR